MANYELVVRRSVYKDLDHIPAKDARRIIAAVRNLSDNPRPPQAKKLTGDEKYRLRCEVYRVLYEIHDDRLVVCVVRVRHRKDVYR